MKILNNNPTSQLSPRLGIADIHVCTGVCFEDFISRSELPKLFWYVGKFSDSRSGPP